MIDSDLIHLFNSRLDNLYVEAERYFERTFKRPQLTFRKSGKHAGTAFLQQNRINLNPVLLTHNQPEFYADVLPHEVSHLLVYQLFGRVKPHGKEWQSIMLDVFGCQPETRHSFDLSPLNLNTQPYRCGCGDVELSIRRHNAVVRGKQRYLCRRCGQELVYITS